MMSSLLDIYVGGGGREGDLVERTGLPLWTTVHLGVYTKDGYRDYFVNALSI